MLQRQVPRKCGVRISLGTNSSIFANCSLFCDVRHVRSSILGQNVMFRKFDVRTFNVRYFGVRSKTSQNLAVPRKASSIKTDRILLSAFYGFKSVYIPLSIEIWGASYGQPCKIGQELQTYLPMLGNPLKKTILHSENL